MPIPAIEEAILGTIIGCKDPKSLKRIDPEYFTDPLIQEAVKFCKDTNTVDYVLIDNHLLNFPNYQGAAYLNNLPNVVVDSDAFNQYVKVLKDSYLQKKLQQSLASAVSQESVSAQMSSVKNALTDIESELAAESGISYKVSDYNDEVLDNILAVSELGGAYSGIPSGIKSLDNMLSGFQKTDMVVVAARPGVGKSSLITTIAQNLSVIKPEAVVVIFSLEMSRPQLIQRMLSSFARIPGQKIRSGHLSLQEWARLLYAKSLLSKCNIYIDDKSAVTIEYIYEVLLAIKAKTGRIDLVFIDYLQLMRSNSRHNSKTEEVTSISGSCKAAAKEFNVPFIVLSQLSRANEQRINKRPQNSDLRESGAIEQDADIILFLYREHMYTPTPENEYLAELIISKHRNGPTGTIPIAYIKEFTRFENLIYNN